MQSSDSAGPDEHGECWAIVLAAGGGTRFGGRKQFAALAGRPMFEHTVDSAWTVCDGVVVVLPADQVNSWTPTGDCVVTAGGDSRAQSVRSGLAAIPAHVSIIVVTDAAHPLATPALYRRVVDAVRDGADAAVAGLRLAEVVKEIAFVEVGARTVMEAGRSLPRETHRLIQTPHAFRAHWLRGVHADAAEAVEDSAMVADAGARVVVVDGEPANIHVTTPEELVLANLMAPYALAANSGDATRSGLTLGATAEP